MLFPLRISSLTQRILKGTFWSMTGTFVAKLLSFASTVILARMLTKDVYGQLGIIRSTVVMLAGIAGCGIGSAATKFIAQYRSSNPDKALRLYFVINTFIIVLAAVSCAALVLFSDWLSAERFNDVTMSGPVKISALILFFTLLNGAQTGTLSGFEDFRHIAAVNVVQGVSQIVFILAGAKLFGLTGAIIGFGISYAAAWACSCIFIFRHLAALDFRLSRTVRHLTGEDFGVLVHFCLPLAATSWISMIVYWWMKTVIVHDSGFSNMANYDVAEQWKTIILVIPVIVANVILPVISSEAGNAGNRLKAIALNVRINLGVSLGMSLLVLVCGNLILSLYGPAYNNPLPLYILCFAAVFDSVSNIFGTLLMSTDNVRYGLVTNTLRAVILVLTYMLLSKVCDSGLENVLSLAYLVGSVVQAGSLAFFVKIKHIIR